MATTSSFSFTNTTGSANKLTPVNVDPISDYAKVADTATSCEMKNKTCTLTQGELLSYQCTPVTKVSTKQENTNPPRVGSGVQYIVRLDELLRTTGADGSIIADDPIVMYLTVRHTNSPYITKAHIETVFSRLCGALQRDDGTLRFDDLMLSALAPTAN